MIQAEATTMRDFEEDAALIHTILDEYGPLDSLEWSNGEEGARQAIVALERAENAVRAVMGDSARA